MAQSYRQAKAREHYQRYDCNCDEKPDRIEGQANYAAQKTPNPSDTPTCPRERDPGEKRPLDTGKVQ